MCGWRGKEGLRVLACSYPVRCVSLPVMFDVGFATRYGVRERSWEGLDLELGAWSLVRSFV